MIPKFRAWISEADTMTNDLKGIDFENETVVLKKFYWEDGFPVEEEVFEVEIGNAILMQSTGLKDKNDKEIFEGDIITDGYMLGVLRNHQTLGFYMVDEKGKENFLSDTVDTEGFEEAKEFMKNSIEIIGNIYENPELLEDKE